MTEPTKIAINSDSFIYAVHQAFEARSKANGDFNSHLRFEPFLIGSWTSPESYDFSSFKTLLSDIIAHHIKVLPHFNRNETVTLENIAWFSHSIAALFADIEFMLVSYTGFGLPKLLSGNLPKATSSKNIVFALKKYQNYIALDSEEPREPFSLFPLLSESEEALDEHYVQEIWSLIASIAKKYLDSYFELFSSYALWKYTAKEVFVEAIDWNVRPPCGIAYRKQFKELFDREREERNARRNEKHSQRKGDKDKSSFKKEDRKPHYTQKIDKNDMVEKPKISSDLSTSTTEKLSFVIENSAQVPEKPRFEGKMQTRSAVAQQQNVFQGASSNPLEPKNQQNLEDALHEVSKAVQKMLKNKSIPEISLNPQNSFVRRQQHVVISEAGFDTESRGDARNRHVCIKRKD
ncbi:R3H domain-containing nucleic acid-binding protein [Fluviispira multicolorata]|uniref:R3H domain-containing nucleic acid-binding protein n=1 Tax=Fluviispira multicolorata TaxID=2654512 RepID=UPI001375B83F|nr:R3H domain-containing nucleic acid-binding protein [Fluviispira multicolorata]